MIEENVRIQIFRDVGDTDGRNRTNNFRHNRHGSLQGSMQLEISLKIR